MKKTTFLITLLIISLVSANATKLQRYITVTGAGIKDGTSWANAASDITQAISDLQWDANYVATDGADLFVAAGTYNAPVNGFVMTDKVNVYGGYPAVGGTIRDWKTNQTILDGKVNQTRLVLQREGDAPFTDYCVWDGFILQNGKAANGAGALLTLKGVLSNCIIRNCDAASSYAIGGAVQSKKNTTAGATAVGCTLYNCLIINNISGKATVNFNTVPAYMIYCTLANNKATGMCGVGTPLVVTDITATGTATAGILLDNFAHWSIGYNNIIWGNESFATNQLVSSNGGIRNFTTCNVQGGCVALDAGTVVTNGLLTTDPKFVRPTSFTGLADTDAKWAELIATDFHIQSASPCIGKASVTGLPTTFPLLQTVDLAGKALIVNGKADMGAYQTGGTTGIFSPRETLQGVTIEMLNDLCLIKGLQNNDNVRIFSVSGKLLYNNKAAVESMFIDATLFGKGVLLVSVERAGISFSQKMLNK